MASIFARCALNKNISMLHKYSIKGRTILPSIILPRHYRNVPQLRYQIGMLRHNSLLEPRCITVRGFSNDEHPDAKKKEQKLSLFQKFKQMYRDYWYVLLPVHLATSAAWFGSFYYAVISGVDVIGLLEYLNVSEKIINPLRDSKMGYVALAYALFKIATPARYAVTLGGTTLSINYLKKYGYIKPVPSKQELKIMYQERREKYKEKKETLLENIREKHEELKDKLKERKHVKNPKD